MHARIEYNSAKSLFQAQDIQKQVSNNGDVACTVLSEVLYCKI